MISCVISAYNEENNIDDCLLSVNWVDEIILINNSSIDLTVTKAKKYTSKIFTRPNNKMLNINKNYGFEKATGEWILNLDADERVSHELKEEIHEAISESHLVGFEIPRKNILFGKWIKHGIWWPDCQLRLFRKGQGKFPCLHIHEKIKVNGTIGKLKNPIIHYNYSSINQFVKKMNDIYTDNEAENLIKLGRKIYWFDAIRMPINDFLANFFTRGSYKDGLHGLVLSSLQAFYAFLVFAKVWEKQKFWEYNNSKFLSATKKELDKSYNDTNYWFKKTVAKSFLKSLLGK